MSTDPWDDPGLHKLQKTRRSSSGGFVAGTILSKVQYWLETPRFEIMGVKFQLWMVLPPGLGMLVGQAAVKFLAAAIFASRHGDFEGLGGLAGAGLAFWVWLRLKNTLGFLKILAIFLAATHAANATNAAVAEWDWGAAFFTTLFVLGTIWVFPRLPGWIAKERGGDPKEIQQLVCLGLLFVLAFMAQPLTGWLFGVDLYAILFDGLLGLGSWGGFVVATLWFLGLWTWTE